MKVKLWKNKENNWTIFARFQNQELISNGRTLKGITRVYPRVERKIMSMIILGLALLAAICCTLSGS